MSAQIALLLDGLILVFLCVTIFYAARLSMFLKTFREGRAGMQILIRDLTTTIAKAEVSINTTKRQMSEAEQELRTVINEAKFLSDELRYMNEGGDNLADRLEKLAGRNRELIDLMEKSGGIGTQTITPFDPAKETEKKNISESDDLEDDDVFNIQDFDIESGLDEDDEMDFQALEDGAYREEMAALRREILDEDDTGLDEKLFADDDEVDELEELHQPRIDTNAKSKVRSFAIFDRDYEEADLKEKIQEKIEQDIEEHASEFYSKAEQDLYEALQRRKKMKEQSS
ncbi:MAG: DUF6468 domain-containing protein [Pseudomonadota bacterium]